VIARRRRPNYGLVRVVPGRGWFAGPREA